MWPERMRARLGHCSLLGKAWLDGYTLRFHKNGMDGSGKCDAFQTGQAKDRLYAAVFELSSSQKHRLDKIEGSGYASLSVRMDSESGSLRGELYVTKPQFIDTTLRPFCWYKALVLEGALHLGLPPTYTGAIRAVDARADPDVLRADKNYALLKP